ncbi:polyubiquitin-tagged protein recognition complex Npl4 component [Heliocybe sulcata]|uniref:Nuclear protein localization protein 4 n=1 Tax=Heliocybe sulcata TaxID=5364 RepID=A0A5C3NJL3_9AGAM|nr:polyubiquitin-tagged protein recognition complex Npl4 component [Heliocybe sulcata]
MLIRIRSKDGNFRFEFAPTADISELVEKILTTTTDADPASITISNQPRGNETDVSTLKGRSLQNLGLKHGDLIFVGYQSRPAASTSAPAEPTAATSSQAPAGGANRPWETVQEDAVDRYWRSKDGMIPRGRDSRFCRHGPNAMCDYCMPLEPYDVNYHQEHNIKHLSFHAYIRQLTPKSAATTSTQLPPLTPSSYKVKVPCPSGHPPWPAAICTSCQPSAITLQSQPFRMVDHLEVASPEIIDRFLQAWRVTGLQRFGWLIGHYEPYDAVPMGIKAVVEAIHEPPQEGELDGLSLGLPWEDEPRIRELAKGATTPLQIVGYIFTDIDPTAEDRTKNVYKRHPNSFFLSSLETIFAATVQHANPTPCRSSTTGHFSSRMVTAVISGTEDGSLDITAYQVSEQAVAMVEADMIEASVDPGTMLVKKEDRSQDSARYVPDVFFRYKNEYGIEVKKSAKPCFPVEYLLVNVSHGFPSNASPLFRSTKFHIENRPGLEDQSIEDVLRALVNLQAPEIEPGTHSKDYQRRSDLLKFLSDWHLVAFLGTSQLFSEADLKVLAKTATAPNLDDPELLDSLLRTESWNTLMTFARETALPRRPAASPPPLAPLTAMDEDIPAEVFDQFDDGGASAAGKVCPHCTFENTHTTGDCDICGLPLN